MGARHATWQIRILGAKPGLLRTVFFHSRPLATDRQTVASVGRRGWYQLLIVGSALACGSAARASAPDTDMLRVSTSAELQRWEFGSAGFQEADPTSHDGAVAGELPKGTTVLQIGDSFAESLGAPLGRHLKRLGIRSVLASKTPSYIPTWASSSELTQLLAKHRPDLVLVTLGGNEFDIPEPNDRVQAVERLVAQLGSRPCVWITPPRWKKDTGVLAVIRAHAAPCRYLDTDELVPNLPRGRDKIHPSEPGRESWAQAVLGWLKRERDPLGALPWALKPAK